MAVKLNFKLLTYDIETLHLKARIWRPGEQVVRHDQLLHSANKFRIVTISYKWHHQKEVHTLTCGQDGLSEGEMIKLFDKQARQADVILGKNNFRFDNKHVNTARLLNDVTAMPEWFYKSDDLESQIRKVFAFPSQSLDYLSQIFGKGGKIKMERQDWIAIEDYIECNRMAAIVGFGRDLGDLCQYFYGKPYKTILRLGEKAYKKMIFYNQKDVTDTEFLLNKVLPHIQLKYNAAATAAKGEFKCIICGSSNIIFGETQSRGQQRRQLFNCVDHKGYAGSMSYHYPPNSHSKKFTGKMGK